MKKNLAILLAGGSGNRLKGEVPKQFLELAGKLVIEHTIEKFECHPQIDSIFVVTIPEFFDNTVTIIEKMGCQKVEKVLKGGKTRQGSSYIGVTAAGEDHENVLIHDAVRPFVSRELIDELVSKLDSYPAVVTAVPSSDTVVRIDEENRVREIPDRDFLRRVQTPQAFKLYLVRKAHKLALENHFENASDDCSLVLRFRLAEVYVVPGSPTNIKITYPLDLILAEQIVRETGL